jgi:FHA domain-containing protein
VADLDLQTTTQLAFMRLVGQLLREATQGAYELLYARRTTKHELRAVQTMIEPKENNPLKFSPDAEAALRQLLSPPVRGFMTPVSAMRDAFDDLEAHQFGVIAGIRAALATLLQRFDPADLEERLGRRSILDSMLPMNRNARLWELFKERYQRLRDEAEEDFHSIFGQAFVRAYEEQIERLRSKHDDEK